MRSLGETIRRSILFYRKDALNQVIIVTLLSAIITGSLLTGHSVRSSLLKNASERLGNTAIVISSGLRYFDASLSDRITKQTREITTSFLETDGYCQNFSTGATVLNTKIYAITENFWLFHRLDTIKIVPGTVAINSVLADRLGVSTGDELIIKLQDIDPIPSNAPFSMSRGNDVSKVVRVGMVLNPDQMGNFSLGISQLAPLNVFISLSDIEESQRTHSRVNRMLFQNSRNLPVSFYREALSKLLMPSDIGLTIRRSQKTGETELISDRIFIDSAIVSDIMAGIPSASPVITYLGNNIRVGSRSTPYSFITSSSYNAIGENEIVISRWLADDLDAKTGDTLILTWYDPGYRNKLEEKNRSFIISNVLANDHPYSDPSLMPDFQGISGSTTCSSWDAGVPILMDKIRLKDEEYWNKYKGTPKAFISYRTGMKLWGNNFGPATAVRFPGTSEPEEITAGITKLLDPLKAGFTITDIRGKSGNAATSGVDFSTLFLGLAFFIIVSCLILLSLAVSMFFDSRKGQIRTYFALGFKNKQIRNLLLSETMTISAAGAITGVFLGYFINIIIIKALNSVWIGAVQTNTLSPDFDFISLLTGFLATMIIAYIMLLVKSGKFLKSLSEKETGELKDQSQRLNLLFFILSLFSWIILFILSLVIDAFSTALSFTAGALAFCTLVFALRQYYIRNVPDRNNIKSLRRNLEKQYFHFQPSHAITPVIFIAAGIFAVIITGANRQTINKEMLLPSGGTGGYLLWAESAVPVRENLNSIEGRKDFGLDETELKDLIFVQAKKLFGDDASCLNLNHVTAPSVLGIDPEEFIAKGSFSFASRIKGLENKNPWDLLNETPDDNTIYGIADQTVLEWGLKIKVGDTLVYRAENGQILNIVIGAGLKSSVFQGYLLVGSENFSEYFPSVSGNSIFLADGDPGLSDYYAGILSERLSGYGISAEPASRKLASFFVVVNTYLSVFMVLGILGMVLGVAGLGFILIRNFNQRKKEFALMMATGYTTKQIRKLLLKDQSLILFLGVFTGTVSGLIATLPSLNSGSEMPWKIITAMILMIIAVGLSTILLSIRTVRSSSLIIQLRRE
ncbi:MAG: ABC transporter permease [Bacteroidia bacterium]|nr:ABC transporter permease [Bacteroidia bacterium]